MFHTYKYYVYKIYIRYIHIQPHIVYIYHTKTYVCVIYAHKWLLHLHILVFAMNLWGLDIFKLINYKNIQDIIHRIDYKCENWQANWIITEAILNRLWK